jgi:hypothetical protein
MDLFTCGAGLLIPILPTIRRLFGLPVLDSPLEPVMKWSHKLCAFRKDYSPSYNPQENPLQQDFSYDILASHDLKVKNTLLSGQTAF